MLFVAFIHVASLGADQFNFGQTLPPSSEIVEVIFECMSGQRREGSGGSSSSLCDEKVEEGVDGEEKIPESVSVEERSGSRGVGSGGRRIPSARR